MKNVVLHQGIRMDNGKEITGFLTKKFGQYHIVLEENENTAYPVEEDSIKPCLEGKGLIEKPWNRWYVNEKMLPRLQDTVLICKGWYNKEKYPNVYEALRAYWAAIAEVSVKNIGYDAVLQCLLLPACEAFLCNRKFCEIFYERIYKLDIVMREFEKNKKHKNKAEYREMNAECPLCDAFTYYEKQMDQRTYTVLLEDREYIDERKIRSKIHLKKQVSPLRYPGGKSKILDLLLLYLHEEKKTFVDVYCGGGSVGLSLLLSGIVEHLVMNDLDKGVYALFHVILTAPEMLIEKIRMVTPDRNLFFQYQKMIKKNYEGYSKLERAFGFLVVNRLAFSGIWNANPTSNLLQRWNPKVLEKRIWNIWEKREQITLLNEDAMKVIEEYYWDETCTLFIDPPYYVAWDKKLYHHCYQEEEHQKLADLLNTLVCEMPAHADILVTYDNHPFIAKLYQKAGVANVETISRNYSIAR